MTTCVATPQSRCRFALAWGDITPPVGIYHRMWGAAKHDRATGIHRPLRATVAAFTPLEPTQKATGKNAAEHSNDLQILVALDHCVLGAVELGQLLDHVSAATGLPRAHFAFVFSHTHAAGLMGLERVGLPGGDLIPPYLQSLGHIVSELTGTALARLQPATIAYGTGRCPLAAHRDFWDADRKQFVCGFNPDRPADDTVLVARVTNDRGEIVASIVNYACHPTTLAWAAR
jgi:hypothetical protein